MPPGRDGDRQALGALTLVVPAAAATGADAHHVDGAMADVVIRVANKILRREFPVTRHVPFLDASQYLRATLSAIATIEQHVQVQFQVTKILQEWRCCLVPRSP